MFYINERQNRDRGATLILGLNISDSILGEGGGEEGVEGHKTLFHTNALKF